MSETRSVGAVATPATVESLTADLRALGIEGSLTILHVSLSALGWVCGGAVAVLQAMEAALGPRGTLVMPAFSSTLSDPRHWCNPPVPREWWPTIRATMPAFDPAMTPTLGVGRVAETFRSGPGVIRSLHPCSSFTARGPAAADLMRDHQLAHPLGEGSPLARLYDRGAQILLLGVDHDRNTSLHLAENRARWPSKRTIPQGGPILVDGKRRWSTYDEIDIDTGDFLHVGAAFDASCPDEGPAETTTRRVADAPAKLMRQRALVDFAAAWFSENR